MMLKKYGMPETVEIDKFGEESIKAMKMSVPVFDGAHEEDMNATLDLAGVDPSGKTKGCMTVVQVNLLITRLQLAAYIC